jgi:xanthine dehydrogenase YagS FAD-binding subunit
MNKFDYLRVASPEEASSILNSSTLTSDSRAKIMAGGTDLLPLMKDGLASPQLVVDLSAWEAGSRIEESMDGLRIGATASLASIAASTVVRERFTALSDACSLSAAPQLRNMGTIGGNLLQQTRCWYYRNSFDCWLKGGATCYAREGQNEQHAIFHTAFDESPCISAHPSDPAAALLSLDALVEFTRPDGRKRMPLESLYALPKADRRTSTTLPESAVITAVILPNVSGSRRSVYVKGMPRAAWAFALAGVAISLSMDGSSVREARVALSGVAPVPIRARQVEALMAGTPLESLDAHMLATDMTSGAAPLQMNGYKVALLQGLFKEALAKLSSLEPEGSERHIPEAKQD